MKFKDVDEETKDLVFNRRRGSEITEMLVRFHESDLSVAEVDEEDLHKYSSLQVARQAINSAIRKYNKKNTAFLSVSIFKNKLYLINRSVI